jgi:hypothetical protein
MINPKPLDVVALSNEVNRQSETGEITKKLLCEGNTLFGICDEFPELTIRITPDNVICFGHFVRGDFNAKFCTLKHYADSK